MASRLRLWRRSLLCCALSGLAAVACRTPATPALPTVQATAPPVHAVSPAPTVPAPTHRPQGATPTVMASPGASTSPTPFPTPSRPVTAGPPPADLAGVIAALPEALREQPDDPGALYARLQAWGALEPEGNPWREADLNGDGQPEILLLLAPPGTGNPITDPRHTRALVVLRRSGTEYGVGASRLFQPAFSLAVPLVHDLTGDGRPEAVVTYHECGAHTCFLYVSVLAPEGGQLRDLVAEPISMSYADLKIEDRDGDGRWEIALHGGSINSVGAGPVQTRTEVYAWDGQTFRLAETLYDPSPVRLHVLFDGDRALRRGDLKAALALYQRVATDPELADDGFQPPAEVRRTLEAFACYRLVTVEAALGDRQAATEWIQVLRERSADHPCRSLAEVFWAAWEPKADLSAACAAATAYAEQHPAVLESFGYYGYGNPTYKVEDLCLLGRVVAR